jgi:hypothetical protein
MAMDIIVPSIAVGTMIRTRFDAKIGSFPRSGNLSVGVTKLSCCRL